MTMGCGDECPVVPGADYQDWDVDDPSELSIEAVRLIRDDIARCVEEFFRRCCWGSVGDA